MYEAFYNLSSDPFKMSPDHRFAFAHDSYSKGRNYLEYGLMRGEGLVVITGLPGTGKSTVIEDLLSGYGSNELEVARIQTTQMEVRELLRLVAYSFGISAQNTDKATLLMRLEEYFNTQYDSGRRVLLIIDEAQNLSQQALEELRLLTNIQRENGLHFQIFLLGQPQLQGLIRAPGMEQLRQRIIASCHFEPLSLEETRGYIEHRLGVAGWQGDPQITDKAFRLIHRYSGGIPRKINMLTSRLLIHGAVDEKHRLSGHEIREVIAELPPEMLEQGRHAPRMPPSATVRPAAKSSAETVKRYERWQQAYRRPTGADSPRAVGNEAVDLHPQDRDTEPSLSVPTMPLEEEDVIPVLTDRVPGQRTDVDSGTLQPEGVQGRPIPPPLRSARPPRDVERETLPELDFLEEEPPRSRWTLAAITVLVLLAVLGGLFAASFWLDKDWREMIDALPRLGLSTGLDTSSAPDPVDSVRATHQGAASAAAPGTETVPPRDPISPTAKNKSSPPPQPTVSPERRAGQPQAVDKETPAFVAAAHRKSIAEIAPRTPEHSPAPDPVSTAPEELSPTMAKPQDPLGASLPRVEPKAMGNDAPPAIAAGEGRQSAALSSDGPAPVRNPAGRKEMSAPAAGGAPRPGEARAPDATLVQALNMHGFATTPLTGAAIKVEPLGGVPFAAGQTRIDDRGRRTLDELASLLRDLDGFSVKVVGHTDKAGDEAYNLYISKQRAISVRNYLIARGVPSTQLRWEGRGEAEPLYRGGEDNPYSSRNRRVDIYIEPLAGDGTP